MIILDSGDLQFVHLALGKPRVAGDGRGGHPVGLAGSFPRPASLLLFKSHHIRQLNKIVI